MASILESLSQGLRGMGAVYSPSVYNTQAQELENERQRSQRNKEMILGLLANAAEAGAISPEVFQQKAQELGMGNLQIGPGAKTQEIMRQQQIAASRPQAMQRIFQKPAKKPPAFSQDSIQAALAMGGGPTKEADAVLQQSGIRQEPDATASPYDPRMDPMAWRTYAQDREQSGDLEEAKRAYAMAESLDKQTAPQLKEVGGSLYQVTPMTDAGNVSGYSATPVPGIAGEAGAREKQAAMIRQEMIRSGASEQEAKSTSVKIAAGAWVRETDPQSGVTRVIDLSSPGGPRIVRQFGTVAATESPTTTATPTDIQPSEAVGVGSVLKSAGNAVADFIGIDIPFQKTEDAANALQNLRINTLSVMQAAGSWRPSVFTSKLLDEVAQQPLQFFRGEARSRARMESTRRMVKQEVDSIDKALKSGNLRPNDVSDYTKKKVQLQQLELEYRTVVNAFDKGKKAKGSDWELYLE